MITASVITYYTNQSDLDRLIECVLKSPVATLFIIDHTPEKGKVNYPDNVRIRYITHENLGYGSGHNVAIREAIKLNTKYHIVLNPDIYWDGDVIGELSDFMDSNDDVAQVMPKVFYPDGRLQYLCKLCPTPFDLIFKRFLPSKFTQKRMKKFQLMETGYDKLINVPYLSGCFMFFRVSAFKEVGLFDERFFMYPEDVDITRRMHAKYRTMFYPYVKIVHAHAAASKTSKKMLKVHILNMIKYFNKWGWLIDRQRDEFNKRLLKEISE